jgi:outer membrane protein insertion porin family
VWHDGPVPDDLRRSWETLVADLPIAPGERLAQEAVTRTEAAVAGWLADRGYPFAAAYTEATVDSALGSSTVLLHATPGPRSRIGAIVVQGNVDVSTDVVLRTLRFRPGDAFDARRLSAGAQRLRSLGIFKLVRVDLVPDQEPDTAVAVRVYVQEDRPRRITGELGYISDGGMTAQAEWSHRNFMGGARTLSVNGVGQTGWLAISDNPDRAARGLVTLRQPQLFRTSLDGLLSPFAEYRNDYRDESWRVGVSTGLVYQLGPIQSVALQYQIARRQILEYRFGDFSSGEIDILTLLALASAGVLDSLGETLVESRVGLTATLGSLDDHSNPRRGLLIRPSLNLTAPSALNTTEYVRFDIGANAFYPIRRRSTIAIRIAVGRLFPFGKSVPQPGENPGLEYLQLRDVAFTAGGTSDVRGWANRELGPKFPDLRVRTEDSTIIASRYVPIGGLARVLTSVEARLPMPLLGDRWGSHVFLDGGRVWTPDDRFRVEADTLEISDYYWAAGLGIDLLTPVGPLRVSLGYKLNPSPLDLRDPADVIRALVNDEPLESVPEDDLRRFQFHFTVGITY